MKVFLLAFSIFIDIDIFTIIIKIFFMVQSSVRKNIVIINHAQVNGQLT